MKIQEEIRTMTPTNASSASQGQAAPAQPRLLWMDIIRGAAILAVITVHSVTFIERYDFNAGKLWGNLNETLTLFRMPILILLSGMLLPKSLAKPAPAYFSGKVRAILWPFLVWSTIYALVTGLDFTSPYELRKLYIGGSHLWFLAFIFVYYLVAKPLRSLDPFAIAAVAFALSLVSPEGEKYSERLFFLMSLFFLGSGLSSHAHRVGRFLRSHAIWFLAPIVAGSAYLTVRHGLTFGPYWVALSFAGFLFFSSLAQRLEKVELSRPLVWIGQRSIVFYVSHAIFIIVVARLAERAGITSYAFTATVSVAVSLAGGWALAAGMERWSPIGWLFAIPAAKHGFVPKPAQ